MSFRAPGKIGILPRIVHTVDHTTPARTRHQPHRSELLYVFSGPYMTATKRRRLQKDLEETRWTSTGFDQDQEGNPRVEFQTGVWIACQNLDRLVDTLTPIFAYEIGCELPTTSGSP